jgi:phosphatidylinositol 3,5-bisphosphate 5-phosphatase
MCDDNKKCANISYIDDLDDISQEDTCCSSDPSNGVAEAEVNGIKHPFLFIAPFLP